MTMPFWKALTGIPMASMRTWCVMSRAAVLLLFILAMVPATARTYTISAYSHRGKTALGTRTRHGICAGPRKYLGRYVRIGGKRYRVEDVCGRGFDIWMPTHRACQQFGRKRMTVMIGSSFRSSRAPASTPSRRR